MKVDPATKQLQSLRRLHRKEVGLLPRKKPLDLDLDGENAGQPTGPILDGEGVGRPTGPILLEEEKL